GYSIATSADGKTIVVGSRDDETPDNSSASGVVYVFDREYSVGVGTIFTEVGILTGSYASDSADYFGYSVATSADGKTIVVGARNDETHENPLGSGVVYIFNRQGNDFNEVGILTGTYADEANDYFGSDVACSADGNVIVIGALRDEAGSVGSSYGTVYVFNRQGNNFNEVGIITGTYPDGFAEEFGCSVACSADGKHIIVGAYAD
ncbi:MAG: hypothetical protein VW270_31520, partial [Candidatus Poseidoniales archaeon]